MTTTDNRREFFRKMTVAGLGMTIWPQILLSNEIVKKKVRLGFIGVGLRGCGHLGNVLRRPDVEVPAICDIDPSRNQIAQDMIEKSGRQKAEVYTGSDFAFEGLLKRDDIDGVIISTPWLWHTRMAVATMKAGKYAGLEVSAANTLEECWDLVNTYEETGIPCMILENVCYRRDIMAVLNMLRQGIFGELVHCRCGYEHDLRNVKFNNGKQPFGVGVEFGEKAISEARWRTQHSVKRDGDLYPTHGVGPIGVYLDINRGNRFATLSSMSTKSKGLNEYIIKNGGANHPNADIEFNLGDIVTTMITTANKETIIVTHDTNLPRPYSLGFRVQGTNGLWLNDGDLIYFEGTSPSHQWEAAGPYLEKYDHPLWKKHLDKAEGSGHGGMDFFVAHAFIESIKRQSDVPLDVYDAAAWSAISPLSEMSIEQNGEVQNFPDFTRGRWIKRKPVFGFSDEY